MNRKVRELLDVALYLVVFLLIECAVQITIAVCYAQMKGLTFQDVTNLMTTGEAGKLLVASSIVSSMIVIVLFVAMKWIPTSNPWIRQRPWRAIIWVALMAVGTILPLEWVYERIQLSMPENVEVLFEGIMKEPWGYMVIGILAPVTEEIVFRGAILRGLLKILGRHHWIAIVITSLLFAVTHMNLAQGIHAFIMGMLLGWVYWRTSSIVPGMVIHWVNNSIAFVMFHLMPDMSDGKMIDLFHGSERHMIMGILFSCCIFVPSLLQFILSTRKGSNESR